MKLRHLFLTLTAALGATACASDSTTVSNKATPNNSAIHVEQQNETFNIAGRKFQVDFGTFVFNLHFQSDKVMTFRQVLKDGLGEPVSVNITMKEIRPNVYMVYWTEPNGNTVVHVEDFEKMEVYTNITVPGDNKKNTFYNLHGAIKEMELTNADKAYAVINSFNTGDTQPVSYINPNKYIQHNLAVGDGLEGFGELMKIAPPEGFKANIVRTFQDENYVILHSEYDFFGPKVGFDIFRFEDGKIVEHWDNISEVAPPNPSGRTQTDGFTQLTDLDKTQANKDLVSDFVQNVLVSGAFDKITNYISTEKYIQHNSGIADGLDGLAAAVKYFQNQGLDFKYDKMHTVLGQGNFVLTVSEGVFANNPKTAFYDLFRVENGKIVEHWDILETIPPKSEWKNENGKFGFQ